MFASEPGSSNTKASIVFKNGANKLHGTWVFEAGQFTDSDRRLKTQVRPLLQDVLRMAPSQVHPHRASSQVQKHKHVVVTEKQREEDALLSVVRQLRPVSFRYKDNAESKHSRYGFVAQELEALLPAVVHADKASGFRFVRYTDLLAVLVLGAQHVEALATSTELELHALDARLDDDTALLDPRLAALERALVDLVASGARSSSVLKADLVDAAHTQSNRNDTTTLTPVRHQGQRGSLSQEQAPSQSALRNAQAWNGGATRIDSDAVDLIAELETLVSLPDA